MQSMNPKTNRRTIMRTQNENLQWDSSGFVVLAEKVPAVI